MIEYTVAKAERSGRLRVPVRFVDGVWELVSGGAVPVRNLSEAELLVDRDSIVDSDFLQSFERRESYKILEEGTDLLVRMTVKRDHPPPERLGTILKSYHDLQAVLATHQLDPFDPATLFFVEVKIAGPNDRHVRLFGSDSGGLWFFARGREFSLATTTILLPKEVCRSPVRSLNHAYSILSETFEPWRISHTGNIYKHVLYKERNDNWYPLDLLRDEALARQENDIANELWAAFLAKMTFGTRE